MNDKVKFIVICRFNSWGENNQYPAFGVKYLFETSIDNYERIEEVFKEKYK